MAKFLILADFELYFLDILQAEPIRYAFDEGAETIFDLC